jgi:hypothetical protein
VNDLICFFWEKNEVNSVVKRGGMCYNGVLFAKQGLNIKIKNKNLHLLTKHMM